ncbi:MAG: DUF3105 domain-containing protein [Actinobacteria bacterium]|nr:DUF3105 domain-containing protein [Actinomycetota bacterium]
MGKAARSAERRARLAATGAEQHRQERRRTLAWVGGTAAVLLLVAGATTWTVVSNRSTGTSNAQPGLTTYTKLSRDHVGGKVTYAQTPPAGGAHAEIWQNCGIYSTPVSNETAVHSLEHGAIWITYRPDLPSAEVKALQAAVRGQPYGLLSPYPGLPSPVVATVWELQLKLRSATDPALASFIAKYADGRHAPEPGGECTGGTGKPQP